MKAVIIVIGLAVFLAHNLPLAAISREIAKRSEQDRQTEVYVSTLPEVESSARLLELYH